MAAAHLHPLAIALAHAHLPPSPSTYPDLQALPVCELRAGLQSPSSLKFTTGQF